MKTLKKIGKYIILLTVFTGLIMCSACGNQPTTLNDNEAQTKSAESLEQADTAESTENHDQADITESAENFDQADTTETAEDLLQVDQNEAIEEIKDKEQNMIYVTVNGTTLTAILEENTSAEALLEKLAEGDITVEMSDYSNFEKVGSLGFDLPRNDVSITTKPGDIILYQGSQLVFYYDTNSWNFTKLGEFKDVTQTELMEIFGDGDISATISVNK